MVDISPPKLFSLKRHNGYILNMEKERKGNPKIFQTLTQQPNASLIFPTNTTSTVSNVQKDVWLDRLKGIPWP
jgi:hypothetical protein